MLTNDGYLRVNRDAEDMRRVLDWFERSWAGSLSSLPALLATESQQDTDQGAIFDPEWIVDPVAGGKLVAPEATWRLLMGLVSALDPISFALMRPGAATGSKAEGEILAVLITHFMEAFDRSPVPAVQNTAEDWARIARKLLARSALFDAGASLADLIADLRSVLGLADANAAEPPAVDLLNRLLLSATGAAFGTLDLGEADLRRFAQSVTAGPGAGQRSAKAFGNDPYEVVLAATLKLQEEDACEAAIIRVFETAARRLTAAGPLTPPDAIVEIIRDEAGLQPADMVDATTAALQAWQGFVSQLKDAFNGVEAARRSATADFVEALLAHHGKHDEGNDETDPTNDGTQLAEYVKASAYLASRLLGSTAGAECFDALAPSLVLLPFPASAKKIDGTPAADKLREILTRAHEDAVAPMAALLNGGARFAPDLAPHPLPIQVSSEFSAAALDEFAKEFNGIAVALRRVDNPAGAPDADRWSHASLAGFRWAAAAAPVDEELVELTGLRQWLPVAQDGRAPMFLDYDGFPLASRPAAGQNAQTASSLVIEARRLPFYETDVAYQANYADGLFARVPRLAYGRQFEVFSFALTNAGTLPLALQQAGAPWLPKTHFDAPADAVFNTAYQRRTTIGAVFIDKPETASAWVAAIPGVQPLSADYARIGVMAGAGLPGVTDLMRESDGGGMLRFPRDPNQQRDLSVRVDLSDLAWSGGAADLSIEFFDRTAGPDKTSPFALTFPSISAATFASGKAISISLESIWVPANKEGDEPHFEDRFGVTVGDSAPQWISPIAPRDSNWWFRLTLASAATVVLSFADPRANSDGERRDAPLLLLAPRNNGWVKGVPTRATAIIRAPRVGYLDFERWFANNDLRAAAFPTAPDKGKLLLDALLAAYMVRHADTKLAAMLDELPDPAVSALRLELVCTDSLRDIPPALDADGIKLGALLDDIAGKITKAPETVAEVKDIVTSVVAAFTFEIVLASSTNSPGLSGDRIEVPAGMVAELRVSPVVSGQHFAAGNDHPAVFQTGLKQIARRITDAGELLYPPATVRIETMFNPGLDRDAAIELANRMIRCRTSERSREYSIVTAATATPTDRNAWRLLREIDVISQRWRPSGRPIYSYISPANHRAEGATIGHTAMPLKPDGPVQQFEAEAFFERRDIDAEPIPKILDPLPPRLPDGEEQAAIGTELQKFPCPSAATYLRHRFRLRSRYAGALARAGDRAVEAWPDAQAAGGDDSPGGWTLRVAVLADGSRIALTRPQMRALMPLTTAPRNDDGRSEAPPVVALLQEPPFTEGGLADRIGAELKVGFGYGFATENDDARVGILDARKEIGPDPRLSYRAMPAGQALGMGLAVEGPVGLSFDSAGIASPAFANSMLSLSPTRVGGSPADGIPASLEEHFLGVALRRYLDPQWIVQARQPPRLDGTDCLWLEFDTAVPPTTLLSYRPGAGEIRPLITMANAGYGLEVRIETAEADAGGANAGQSTVAITTLPPSGGSRLAILHAPVAPGRYSASIFAATEDMAVKGGRSNQPYLLASFEWSPIGGSVEQKPGIEPNKKQHTAIELVAPSAKISPTNASAPTFLAWTRTSRDFDRIWGIEPGGKDGKTAPTQMSASVLVARRRDEPLALGFARPDEAGDNVVHLQSSLWHTSHPIHVHRHLALLGTRRAPGMGRPIEVFSGAALMGPAGADIAGTALQDATGVRILEFETPASILCARPNTVPHTYNSSYVDLRATGGDWDRAITLFFRFVGDPTYVAGFNSVTLHLALPDRPGEGPRPLCDLAIGNLVGVVGAEVSIVDGQATLRAIKADGSRAALPDVALTTAPDPTDPGLIVTMSIPGIGEFWADISMLHSAAAAPAAIAVDAPSPNSRFDFDWLFSNPGSEPSLAVQPAELARMIEVQARIVSVSPTIPVKGLT